MERIFYCLLIVLCASWPTVAFGQIDPGVQVKTIDKIQLGLYGGPGSSWFGGKDAHSEMFETSGTVGYKFGGLVQFDVSSWLRVQGELGFARRGAELLVVLSQRPGVLRLSYLEIPILAEAALYRHRWFSTYLILGPQLEIMVGCTLELGTTGDCESDYKAIDLVLMGGAGVEVHLPWSGTVSIDARYDFGLIGIDDRDVGVDLKNRAVFFTLGYQHNLADLVARLRGEPRSRAKPTGAAEPAPAQVRRTP